MVSDKLYRRMTYESPRKRMMRHNGIRTYGTQRRCMTCNPNGAMHSQQPCTSKTPCSDGWRSYTIRAW